MLVLLTCGLFGGKSGSAIQPAIAVELLHTATLLHDDVVDMSTTRRGAPTVNGIWSNRISVLTGDYLFSKVIKIISELDDSRYLDIICTTTDQMSRGELLQEEHNYTSDVDEELYIRLITQKTASLFSACCQLGALIAGADDEELENISQFGNSMGIAFQIRDDLLDFIGEEGTMGKPPGNDIRNQKITLPLLYALKTADPEAAEEILAKFDNLNDIEVEKIIAFCKTMNGISYTEEKAELYSRKALESIKNYPDSRYLSAIVELVHFVTSRQK
jgi:octaprenyl-diphosphate synthase